MTLYLDSGALVKLYVFEQHNAEVATIAQRTDVSFTFNGMPATLFKNEVDEAHEAHFIGVDMSIDGMQRSKCGIGSNTRRLILWRSSSSERGD